jgi:hypothetical protein
MIRENRSATDRAAGRVLSWTEFYTTGLPTKVRVERLDEIRSDLHEQMIANSGSRAADLAVARSIRARSIRGVLADVSWRRTEVRQLQHRRGTIAVRAVLAVMILVAAVIGTVLFVNSGMQTSSASLDRVQVGYLKDQVHGEALFVVPLAKEDAIDASDIAYLASDPNYAMVLPGMREGVLAEYSNLRILLSQLASERQIAEKASADARQRSVQAQWLTGVASATLIVFVLILWFEPRWPAAPRTSRSNAAKS